MYVSILKEEVIDWMSPWEIIWWLPIGLFEFFMLLQSILSRLLYLTALITVSTHVK